MASTQAQQKVAIITGAGSGVGQAVAITFLANGYKVALAGRRQDALQKTIEMAKAGDANALAVPTDVTDPAAVNALFDKTVAKFGRVDVVFNNAGIGAPGINLEDLTPEHFDRTLKTNLYALHWIAQAATPHHSPGAAVITTASVQAYDPSAILLD